MFVMEIRKSGVPIEETSEIDRVNCVSKLGHEPLKMKEFDYWYFSRLGNVKIPSFKATEK